MNNVLSTVIAVGILGAIALPSFANETREPELPAIASSAAHLLAQSSAVPELSQETDYTEEEEGISDELIIDDELSDEIEVREVEVYLRLSTEVFRYGDDNVEFQVPIRYSPSDDLSLEISPFMKYQPDDLNHTLDYGVRGAVQYRL